MKRFPFERILCAVLSTSLLVSGVIASLAALSGCAEKSGRLPDGPVDAGIYVPKIDGIGDADGFMRGADVSSLMAELNSGVRFTDWEGNSLGNTVDEQGRGFMKLLREAGFNYIRLRVWNDPTDASGHGYGGGSNDISTAVRMGEWASGAGLKVMIDFHYSDFWADPSKQQAPKSWADKTAAEKEQLIYDFTKDCLRDLSGVDVGIVQIGNETTSGFCGERDRGTMCRLFNAGSRAVRESSKDILVALHFTEPQKEGFYDEIAEYLAQYKVDYDVFASSYYPYWHGTIENLTAQLKGVADKYGKKIMVAETSWAYTADDGDGHNNTIGAGFEADLPFSYSVQGQASELAAVTKAVKDTGGAGIGVFWWEPAWIPVEYAYGEDGTLKKATVAMNKGKWQQYGSGWAASYAGEYDPDDAGEWYGGSAVDNQALFDFWGRPLESLKSFLYMQTGTTAPLAIESASLEDITLFLGDDGAEDALEKQLLKDVDVVLNTGETASLPVSWDNAGSVDVGTAGEYPLTGKVDDRDSGLEFPVSMTVRVMRENLLKNPGFEQGGRYYELTGWSGNGITDKEPSNVHDGDWCLHFYSPKPIEGMEVSQTVTLEPGDYRFTLYAQGGSVGPDADTHIFARFGETELTERFDLTAWREWKTPVIEFTVAEPCEVTLGAAINAGAGAWGSFDDWELASVRDGEETGASDQPDQ